MTENFLNKYDIKQIMTYVESCDIPRCTIYFKNGKKINLNVPINIITNVDNYTKYIEKEIIIQTRIDKINNINKKLNKKWWKMLW